MVSLQTYRPLDFSSFPALLLIATVLRLALNVASTRIVLSEGHTGPDAAGQVIKAFGEFVIAGIMLLDFCICNFGDYKSFGNYQGCREGIGSLS